MKVSLCAALALALLALAPIARADDDVKIVKDGGVTVTTPVYKVAIDANGVMSLWVKDAAALVQRFVGEKDQALSVNVTNNMAAIRAGKARIEYTFSRDEIKIVTEGFQLGFLADASVKAAIVPGGKGGPWGVDYYANSTAIVLANGLTAAYTMPMHLGPASNRTVFPSCYVNGSGKKAGDLLEFSLKLGAPADALQMLGGITLRPIGSDFAALRKNGNQAAGVTYFPDPNRLALRTVQQNLADKPFEIEYRLTVLDHYVAGKIACDLKQSVKVDPNGKADLQWPLPALPAGFYYATVEAHSGDKKLTDAKITFAVDLDHYTHPLTRPADFKEFWAARLKALRALPFDEKLTEDANRSTEAMRFFNLELTVAGGRRVKTLLLTPRKEGKYMARFAPAFDGKPTNIPTDSVLIGMPLGEFQMATYNRWVSAEDNNMLDCYLLALRLTDYLRSRADVDRIYLFGASRTGPIQFVNAALDGSRIAAVDVHVPTSAGIGWADKPYYAWGVPSGYTPTDANAVARFTAMAAYFDPVNFAPDMKAPFITAYGIDDTLSQPQGIELMYQLAASPWKRISRDPGGHQYSPGFQQLQKELAEHLKTAVSGTDDKIMKEH